jgi:ribosomal protein S18 acetylase RimI-like enzyme
MRRVGGERVGGERREAGDRARQREELGAGAAQRALAREIDVLAADGLGAARADDLHVAHDTVYQGVMDRPRPSVRRATRADREVVVRTLARAFDADPAVTFFARKDAGRARAIETMFDVSFMHLTLPFGESWMTDDGRGVALWTPPGKWSTLGGLLGGPRLLGAVGIGRVLTTMRAVGRVQDVHPKAPHYYLYALGVTPEAQGRGLGSALLSEVLTRCDAERACAYLEASTEANARLYARHGFRASGQVTLAEPGPVVTTMWRDPRS